jgi:predicted ester cyclase
MMSTEENKALVSQLIAEVITKGNFQLADELLAPDFILHVTAMGKQVDRHGPDSFKEVIRSLRAAWSEVQARPLLMIAEGDMVACQVEINGRHHQGPGAWRGIPPTGNHATWTGYRFFRITKGKIAEIRSMEDELSLLLQLGATLTLPRSAESQLRRDN